LNDFVSQLGSLHIINCVHYVYVGFDKLYGSNEFAKDTILMLRLVCRIKIIESLSLVGSNSTGPTLIQNQTSFYSESGMVASQQNDKWMTYLLFFQEDYVK
jgi:hypothetical protein